MIAPLPPDEEQRLATLRQYEVLDTPPDQAFDDLALLAAHICQVPTAMVSLVDEKRQWFKARVGMAAAETPRNMAFCAHTILHRDEVMVIEDARLDPRFSDSALVTEDPHIRFYAGAPLIAPDGQPLGALCVMDRMPRTMTAEQLAALQALSRRVVAQLELRRQARRMAAAAVERQEIEVRLSQQYKQLVDSEREAGRLLELAERSRRGLLSVLEDEKRAGRNLRESEERFRQVVENIHEVFWMTDVEKARMLYVSPGYAALWGRSCESLYADPATWIESIFPEDRARVLEAAKVKQVRGDYDETYRITRPDGTVRWIRDRAFPIRDAAGQVHRIVGTAEDVTEYRKLEEQFRQAQKMEAIGTLAGGIAHDFNNILTGIIGYTEFAKLEAGPDPRIAEELDAVLHGAQRAAALVRQILAFSRRQEQERQLLQLRHVVSEALKLLRATIPATIEFEQSLASDAPGVLADATQVHQVVMNLCTNAAHAMRERPGRLSVKLEKFQVDAEFAATKPGLRPGAYALLSVQDTGHGMDAATQARIFEPFFTTKPVGQGTGLGLAAVHGIMQNHEGVVTVYSHPGEGTTFHLYFPAHAGESAADPTVMAAVPRGAGERIIYVDDELSLARLGQKILERLGYAVETHTKAAEALDAVRARPDAYQLVITDQMMPGMTGVDLAQELHTIRTDLPIILTTGYSATLTTERVRAAGISKLLPKPLSVESLGSMVHQVLAEARRS